MKNLDKTLQNAKQEIDRLSKTSPTAAGPADNSASTDPALIDTINQIFSLLRVNFHNQFYAAFGDSDTLNQAKRMWLNAVGHYDNETLLLSTKKLIENSEYLPTLNQFIKQCDGFQYGLLSNHEAYMEACNAAGRLNSHKWSSPAVYHAGRATGWQTLRSLPERTAFPLFVDKFEKQKALLRKGETLALPEPQKTAKQNTNTLTLEERKQRLEKLKEELSLD